MLIRTANRIVASTPQAAQLVAAKPAAALLWNKAESVRAFSNGFKPNVSAEFGQPAMEDEEFLPD